MALIGRALYLVLLLGRLVMVSVWLGRGHRLGVRLLFCDFGSDPSRLDL